MKNDDVIMARVETVYGTQPSDKSEMLKQRGVALIGPLSAKKIGSVDFHFDCPKCSCGISGRLEFDDDVRCDVEEVKEDE